MSEKKGSVPVNSNEPKPNSMSPNAKVITAPGQTGEKVAFRSVSPNAKVITAPKSPPPSKK